MEILNKFPGAGDIYELEFPSLKSPVCLRPKDLQMK